MRISLGSLDDIVYGREGGRRHSQYQIAQTVNLNGVAACIPASESVTGQGLCWNPSAPPGSLTETSNTNLLRAYYSKFGWTQGIFNIGSGASACTISEITIAHGDAHDFLADDDYGGAILTQGGQLTLISCNFDSNGAEGLGGA